MARTAGFRILRVQTERPGLGVSGHSTQSAPERLELVVCGMAAIEFVSRMPDVPLTEWAAEGIVGGP
jgi:hypothetical protein